MPAIGKVTRKKVNGDVVLTDEAGQTWVWPKPTGRPLLLDMDPRIDLTKPSYEQVLKLEAKDKATAARAKKRKRASGNSLSGGLLLDSHILLRLELQLPISSETLVGISDAGSSSRLFMSDISVWEIGVAFHKKNFERRPDLQGLSVQEWFRKTTANFNI